MQKVKSNRWENADGSYIVKMEFDYQIGLVANGKLVDFECATSFEKALAVLDRLYDRK